MFPDGSIADRSISLSLSGPTSRVVVVSFRGCWICLCFWWADVDNTGGVHEVVGSVVGVAVGVAVGTDVGMDVAPEVEVLFVGVVTVTPAVVDGGG